MSVTKQRRSRSTTPATTAAKPFKGGLLNCTIIRFKNAGKNGLQPETYGKNLGFLLACDFDDHPEFRGFEARGGHTSLVQSMDQEGNVETLNSRYKILDYNAPLPEREINGG